MNDPRVLFAGTPAFALASLEALVDGGYRPVAVLTQPDRPAGRGKKLTPSPVKTYALEQSIPVLQPTTLRDPAIGAELEALKPDLMIVAAYGLILPQSVLDIPAKGCLNVHGSVLPAWRGAAPIQAAILAGDEQTGISLMAMTAGLDCGPVYVSEAFDIGADETAGELHDRLAALGGDMLVRHLPGILDGSIAASEQDDDEASYAGKIATADAELDWQLPAMELHRRVRAYNPAPGAWFMLGDERIKCWRAAIRPATGQPPGTLSVDDGVVVACGDCALSLDEVQRPGKKPVSAREFSTQLDLDGKRLG
ncbi:MAG: methionyl-tRNA formyltransferase [Woeseiaceae bacterium]|nr:methionyl-tRNA formyltransferase [Woeseiaceae bacterium]